MFSHRRRLRRLAEEPRMELIPLVDVVFQMLFFFMVALTVMSQVKSRTVAMAPVHGSAAQAASGSGAVIRHFLVVDGAGRVVLDDRTVEPRDLDEKLKVIAAEDGATLHVGLEQAGTGDRGPAVFDLIQRVGSAGIPSVTFTQLEGIGAAPEAGGVRKP